VDTGNFTGRLLKASVDAVTGLIEIANGQPQFMAGDELGRLWTRLVNGNAPVDAANPLPVTGVGVGTVEGDIAHDSPDVGSNPLKVGGHANAGLRPAVSEDDRVDASYDLNGRARVVAVGNVANDAPDSGEPVKIGARARDEANPFAPVAVDDRVDLAATRIGDLWVALRQKLAGEQREPEVDAIATIRRVYAEDSHLTVVSAPTTNTTESTRVGKSAPGNIYEAWAFNNAAQMRFFLLFNSNVAPTTGVTVPLVPALAIPSGGNAGYDFSQTPLHCSEGIAAALSTTPGVYTAPAAASGFIGIRRY
jgi:hypothetical protein